MVPNSSFSSSLYPYKQKKVEMPKEANLEKPFILFMDSLSTDVDDMMQYLREYLELEFLEKKVDAADKKHFLTPSYGWKLFDQQRLPHYCPNLPK